VSPDIKLRAWCPSLDAGRVGYSNGFEAETSNGPLQEVKSLSSSDTEREDSTGKVESNEFNIQEPSLVVRGKLQLSNLPGCE